MSMNNLNAPNFIEKVIPLENFDEFLEEQSGLYVNQQVNKSIPRRQPIAERLKNQPRSQSPEMLALKSLEVSYEYVFSLKCTSFDNNYFHHYINITFPERMVIKKAYLGM